jgi:hypothetical protein
MDEVGVEDQNHETIMEFCRKDLGIYDFQLTVERLEELGCMPKEVRMVLKYLHTKHKLDTMYPNRLHGGFWVHFSY